MGIDIELCERTHVDLVFITARYCSGKRFVKPVNALDDDGLLGRDSERVVMSPLPFTSEEIIIRQLDLLPLEQGDHLLVEQRDIERFKGLEIIDPFRRARRIRPVAEVIVQGDGHRLKTIHAQLDAEALCERSLPRGRRPGNEYEAQLVAPLRDVVGNLSELFLLERLRDADDITDLASAVQPIEIRHIVAVQYICPPFGLEEHMAELRLRHSRGHFTTGCERRCPQ